MGLKVMANNKNKNRVEAVIFMSSGLLAGVGVSATVGAIGVAVAEMAIGIGLIPVAAAGAVVGLAAYGLKQILWWLINSRSVLSDFAYGIFVSLVLVIVKIM